MYGVVLNHVHFNNLNGRWLCLRAIGIQELAKQFRFLFMKYNICYENCLSQVGAGGVVELSDEHGITDGDESIRVRVKFGKRYKLSVRCQSNHVGRLKIPIFVVFYHDALSENVEDEEDPMPKIRSIMVVELLLRTQTSKNTWFRWRPGNWSKREKV